MTAVDLGAAADRAHEIALDHELGVTTADPGRIRSILEGTEYKHPVLGAGPTWECRRCVKTGSKTRSAQCGLAQCPGENTPADDVQGWRR